MQHIKGRRSMGRCDVLEYQRKWPALRGHQKNTNPDARLYTTPVAAEALSALMVRNAAEV